jgi:hypothetical protein
MLVTKILRPLFAICLSCLLLLNSFASPALADDVYMMQNGSMIEDVGSVLLHTIEDVVGGFWRGFGETVGGAAGAVTVCYVVDVAIVPLFPPAATYLPMCPAIGATVGTFSSVKAISKAAGHA